MGGDDGVGFDVHGFGFGLLAHAREGGFVFLFLEGACHFYSFGYGFFGTAKRVLVVVIREEKDGNGAKQKKMTSGGSEIDW